MADEYDDPTVGLIDPIFSPRELRCSFDKAYRYTLLRGPVLTA